MKGGSKLRIAICDDEASQIEMVTFLIEKFRTDYPDITVESFGSAEELIDQYERGERFDFLFLDIQMKGITGVDAASRIREKDQGVIIIFISAHSSYVSGAFNAKAFHYLLKPFQAEEFYKVFEQALAQYSKDHYKYSISFKNQTHVVEVRDIVYIESYKRKLTVNTADGNAYETYSNMSREAKKLAPYGFVQTHQGFLVNVAYVEHIGKDVVQLKENRAVPLSEHRKREVVKFLNTYLSRCGL